MSKFITLTFRDDYGNEAPFLMDADVIRTVWKDGEGSTIWTKDDKNVSVCESYDVVAKMLMEGEGEP